MLLVVNYDADFLKLFSTTDPQTTELRLTVGANRLISAVWISGVCVPSACFPLDQRLSHEQSEILRASQRDHSSTCVKYIDSGIYHTPASTMTSAEYADENCTPQGFIVYAIQRHYKHTQAAQ